MTTYPIKNRNIGANINVLYDHTLLYLEDPVGNGRGSPILAVTLVWEVLSTKSDLVSYLRSGALATPFTVDVINLVRIEWSGTRDVRCSQR